MSEPPFQDLINVNNTEILKSMFTDCVNRLGNKQVKYSIILYPNILSVQHG